MWEEDVKKKSFIFSHADGRLLLLHGSRRNVLIETSIHPSIYSLHTWFGIVTCFAKKFGVNTRVSEESLKVLVE
jgi:hypothetical protein